MKTGVRLLVFALLAVVVSSCISYDKNLILKGEEERFEDATLNTPTPEYRLRVNDVVYVEVSRLYMGDEAYTMGDALSSQMRGQLQNPYIIGNPIREDGNINIPLIGEVNAAGLTIDELNASVAKRADEMYSSASVKLFLLTQNVTVIGEVPRSGRYQYYTEYINIFDAIAMAGGFTDFSDRNNVKILREDGDQTKVMHIDLANLSGMEAGVFKLMPNDVIVISPQKRKRWVANNNFGVILSSITVVVTVVSLLISVSNTR